MRTIAKYELKEGENRINLPDLSEIVCAANWEGKFGVLVEVETEAREFVDRAFLVVGVGEEIKEGMVLNFVGCVCIPEGSEPVVVFEIL